MDLNPFVNAMRAEINTISSAFKDKGRERFGRPIAIGLAVVLGSYAVVYRPSQAALAAMDVQIVKAKSIAKYAQQYSDLHDELSGMFFALPPQKDRENWLLNTVRGLLDSDGLVTDELQPPTEQMTNGLVFQTVTVTLSHVKFNDVAKFVQQVDESKPFLAVTNLEITKRDLDQIVVSCEISTVIPVQRTDQ